AIPRIGPRSGLRTQLVQSGVCRRPSLPARWPARDRKSLLPRTCAVTIHKKSIAAWIWYGFAEGRFETLSSIAMRLENFEYFMKRTLRLPVTAALLLASSLYAGTAPPEADRFWPQWRGPLATG